MHARFTWIPCFLLLAACGGPADLGGGCDPAAMGSCVERLVCGTDESGANVCQIPLGAECDPMRDPSGCFTGSSCIEVTETVDGTEQTIGRCYITEGGECDPENDFCDPSLTCAEITDGTHACYRPLVFRGRVLDSTDQSAIEGAHVIGLDDESVAVTDVAVSAADGTYSLEVPVVRETDGTPVDAAFTLRGSADGYQTFPGGIRTALPIHTSTATESDDSWVVQGTLTDVVLIPLADPSAPRISVSGHVMADTGVGGVLVVAEGADGGISAVSDASGAYTIFNVPPGEYEVHGYAAGLQLTPASITAADADLTDVDLGAANGSLGSVSGSVNIVNAFGGAATSVVLVVESTFSDTFARGEVPPGLRAPRTGAPSITGAFTIDDVPDGRYVVLAAFENDRLVRDPDTNIAGTQIVHIEVTGGAPVTLSTSFKVTEALPVVTPGADLPEAVTTAPTLTWGDDSSEEYYSVQVFNAYGDMVWEDTNVPSVSGSANVSVAYGGPLESGMYYQFRATSWRAPGGNPAPISTTEDLLGVFYVP